MEAGNRRKERLQISKPQVHDKRTKDKHQKGNVYYYLEIYSDNNKVRKFVKHIVHMTVDMPNEYPNLPLLMRRI